MGSSRGQCDSGVGPIAARFQRSYPVRHYDYLQGGRVIANALTLRASLPDGNESGIFTVSAVAQRSKSHGKQEA
ncbi:hypothetical protein BDI4_410007 [Burkholderia diffusa]|nr:hypothetical protein BDI4_410007 [Burkholderia diffusa]